MNRVQRKKVVLGIASCLPLTCNSFVVEPVCRLSTLPSHETLDLRRGDCFNKKAPIFNLGDLRKRRSQRHSDLKRTLSLSLSQEQGISGFNEKPICIPPEDTPNLKKLEQEFYGMMRDFTSYSSRDINAIESKNYRALYEGVASGATEPEVLRAFAIIYTDLYPIRVAGRMIYRHLKDVMEKNIDIRAEEEERVADYTGLSQQAIDDGRAAFMAILTECGGEGQLTMDQLVDSGIVQTVVEVMEYESFDDFVDRMELDNKEEKLNFEKFMVGLQVCADTKSCEVNCDLTQVLSEIVKRMKTIEGEKDGMSIPERKKKYSDRYDGMVKSFEEWEDLVPSGDGRMIEVLKGCFAGAKNERIVGALKIVYMDYSALRVGGDLVFKLMRKVVGRRQQQV